MNRTNPTSKRKAPPFKPPRPLSKPKVSSTTGSSRRKSAPARPVSVSSDGSSSQLAQRNILSDENSLDSDDNDDTIPPSPSQPVDPSPSIPPKLLTKLLHHHFENGQTRIGKDASKLVGKYMDTFVREALARAAYERAKGEGGGATKDFLEAEDLEKLAPQLLMDF